jgi:hypothetical protein
MGQALIDRRVPVLGRSPIWLRGKPAVETFRPELNRPDVPFWILYRRGSVQHQAADHGADSRTKFMGAS